VLDNHPADAEPGADKVEYNPFRAYEGLFKREKTVFPVNTDLTGSPVHINTPMVAEKIIGFSVRKITDGMAVLFKVVAQMDTPGRMPKPFPAHNKHYPHFSSL